MAKTADKYKKLLEKIQGMDLGGGYWKCPKGRSVIRILPPVGGMDFFFVEVGQHYIDGSNYTCPAITSGGEEKCPVCETNELLFQAGEKSAAANYRVNQRFWMNVIDRKDEDSGPQIFTPGKMIFSALVALISDPDYGAIDDEYDGFDVKIDKTGEGLDTKYSVLPARNPTPLSADDDELEDWLDEATDLKKKVFDMIPEYDALVKESGVGVYLYDEEEEDEPMPEGFDGGEDEKEPASKKIEKRLAKRQQQRGSRRRTVDRPTSRRRRR